MKVTQTKFASTRVKKNQNNWETFTWRTVIAIVDRMLVACGKGKMWSKLGLTSPLLKTCNPNTTLISPYSSLCTHEKVRQVYPFYNTPSSISLSYFSAWQRPSKLQHGKLPPQCPLQNSWTNSWGKCLGTTQESDLILKVGAAIETPAKTTGM